MSRVQAVEKLNALGITLGWRRGVLYAYRDGCPPERVNLHRLAKNHDPQLVADFLEEVTIADLKAKRTRAG